MHVLVTGGYGFIGHHVVKRLKDGGHRVTIIDDLRYINTELYMARGRYMEFGYDDWINTDCSKTVIQDVDVIVHLAGEPNQSAFAKDNLAAWRNTVQSTIHLLTAYPNAKMVYVSSSMVYGDWSGEIVEDSVLKPINDYGKAKKMCEELVRIIAQKWVIIRPTAVYGNRDDNKRVISKWIRAALNQDTIHVDDSQATLDFTYVEDVAQAITNAAVFDTHNLVANVSYGSARTLQDAINIIKDWTNTQSKILYGNGIPYNMPKRGALDIRRAVQYLGYTPKTSLEDGINKLLQP
jgi:nucleoside-diphosphate-sugar epimerase